VQPAAVHQTQFAVASSLAIYVHASDSYRLLKILAQHNRHLHAITWSPLDPKLLACATSDKVPPAHAVAVTVACMRAGSVLARLYFAMPYTYSNNMEATLFTPSKHHFPKTIYKNS